MGYVLKTKHGCKKAFTHLYLHPGSNIDISVRWYIVCKDTFMHSLFMLRKISLWSKLILTFRARLSFPLRWYYHIIILNYSVVSSPAYALTWCFFTFTVRIPSCTAFSCLVRCSFEVARYSHRHFIVLIVFMFPDTPLCKCLLITKTARTRMCPNMLFPHFVIWVKYLFTSFTRIASACTAFITL